MTGMRLRQSGLLLLARLFLVLGLPFLARHAVNDLPRVWIAQAETFRLSRLTIPTAQAIPAEPRQIHQIDVLHVGPFAQMLDQAAERGSLKFGLGGGVRCGFGHGVPPVLPAKLVPAITIRHSFAASSWRYKQ